MCGNLNKNLLLLYKTILRTRPFGSWHAVRKKNRITEFINCMLILVLFFYSISCSSSPCNFSCISSKTVIALSPHLNLKLPSTASLLPSPLPLTDLSPWYFYLTKLTPVGPDIEFFISRFPAFWKATSNDSFLSGRLTMFWLMFNKGLRAVTRFFNYSCTTLRRSDNCFLCLGVMLAPFTTLIVRKSTRRRFLSVVQRIHFFVWVGCHSIFLISSQWLLDANEKNKSFRQ